jgi:ATP-dependent helicase/nuclease subunit A
VRPHRDSPVLPDAGDRRRAATVFDRNLVVTAGAGTGKTALLVERALNLIGSGAQTIDAVAAITFTEKAAAELRERLALGLDRLRSLAARDAAREELDPAIDAHRAYAWLRFESACPAEAIGTRALAALVDLDASSVSTIHAFCSEILRRHPREAGVDPEFAVDEGPSFDRLFEEEWGRFLADEMGPDGGRAALWRRLLRRPGALAAAGDLGGRLASFAFPAEALRGPAAGTPAGPRLLLGAEAAAARAAIEEILRRAAGLAPKMARFLPSVATHLAAFLENGIEGLRRAAAPIPPDEIVEMDLPIPGTKVTDADASEMRRAAKRAHDLLRALGRLDEETIGALAEAAIPLAGRCRERLLEAGFVSFDGLLRLTRDLLAAHPPLRRALAARFRTLLVDEFQDTDPLQYEILFFIAGREEPPSADAYGADLAPGRLFIVGDPKQSIYRFRGADIEAYRRAVGRVLACGGESLTLTASFRSPGEIVDPINALFAGWIGPRAPGDEIYEPRYDLIASARGRAGAEPRVEIWSVAAEGAVEERRRGEARAIAAWITDNVGSAAATGAPLAHGEIAILLRALTNAGLYAQALRRAGIPFVVEGGKGFYERPEVGDLIAFLRAAASPNDGPAVLAVMRSPVGGAPDTELARFAVAGGRLDIAGGGFADLAPFPNVRRTLDLLARFRRGMIGRAVDDIVRAALEETPLALLHAAAHEGAQRIANLRKIVALAEGLARQGLSLEETLRAVEQEFQGERGEGESPLADETIDAVRLLSVHKAKGLEFPVVFVPDLGRESKPPRPRGTEAVWVRRGDGGALGVLLPDGACNAAWILHAATNRRHEAAEEKRVFYVACTRARERLVLVNSSAERSAPWRDALAALGYSAKDGFPPEGLLHGGSVRHRLVAPRPPAPPPSPAEPDSRWVGAATRFEEVSASARASAVPPLSWPAGARDAEQAGAGEAAGESWAPEPRRRGPKRDVLRLAGRAVHAALEHWDFLDAARLRDLAHREARRVAADGAAAAPGPARRVEEETLRIVDLFLATRLPKRLAALAILGREVPILYRDDVGTTWVGACDLVYRDSGGSIVVADYKTDDVTGDPSAAVARYTPQLTIYRAALSRALGGRPVKAQILFVRAGTAVDLPS